MIHILVEFLQLLFNFLALLQASEGLALSQASVLAFESLASSQASEGFWVLPGAFEGLAFSQASGDASSTLPLLPGALLPSTPSQEDFHVIF